MSTLSSPYLTPSEGIFRVVADGDEVLIRRQIGGDGLNLLQSESSISRIEAGNGLVPSSRSTISVEPIEFWKFSRAWSFVVKLTFATPLTRSRSDNRIDSGLFRVVCDIGRDGDLCSTDDTVLLMIAPPIRKMPTIKSEKKDGDDGTQRCAQIAREAREDSLKKYMRLDIETVHPPVLVAGQLDRCQAR